MCFTAFLLPKLYCSIYHERDERILKNRRTTQMNIFKFSGRAVTFTAAGLLAMGLAVSTPGEAQAASKTGNFLLGAAAGAAGLAIIHGLNKNRRAPRRYYQPAPRRYYYQPAPRRYYAPAAWTPAWYRYCSRKYRSFNPNTGYYRPYSGGYRFCR